MSKRIAINLILLGLCMGSVSQAQIIIKDLSLAPDKVFNRFQKTEKPPSFELDPLSVFSTREHPLLTVAGQSSMNSTQVRQMEATIGDQIRIYPRTAARSVPAGIIDLRRDVGWEQPENIERKIQFGGVTITR